MRKIWGILVGLMLASAANAQPAVPPAQCVTNAAAGGTPDAITVPLLPCGLATNILILTLTGANTTASPTLQMVGFAALPIRSSTNGSIGVGALPAAGAVVMLTSTGTSWLLLQSGVASVANENANTVYSGPTSGPAVQPTFRALVTADMPADVAEIDVAKSWTAAQRATPVVLALATATATPNFDTGQNFKLGLTSACPCTFANPSTTPVAGQTGVIEIDQDGTGSRTVGTWGSFYVTTGGVAAIALSTGANAQDYFSYYIRDATHVVISTGVLNAVH